jgi:hypothetical protein
MMKTKHAEIRAQQRGVRADIEELLRTHGEVRPAPHGCVMRFFSRKAIKEIESEFGHFFIAKNHENLRTYLIESREDRSVVTVGKLYQDQRLTKSKVNRLYH